MPKNYFQFISKKVLNLFAKSKPLIYLCACKHERDAKSAVYKDKKIE